jgi:uncharacterized protein (DUF983 family)
MPSIAARPPKAKPTLKRMLLRAAVLHCPWCGSRRTFVRSWFGRHERCRTCGIRWHREEGSELGAVTVNTLVTFLAIAIGMAIGFIATAPDVAVVPMLVVLGAIALLMPIAIYPFTYTLWLAIDLAMHRPEPPELADAAAAVAIAEATRTI